MSSDHAWENQMSNLLGDLEDYAAENRPPPRENLFSANFKGLFTCQTSEEASGLARAAQNFVRNSVNIFSSLRFEDNDIQLLCNDINDIAWRSKNFSQWVKDEYLKQRAAEKARDIENSLNILISIFERYVRGSKVEQDVKTSVSNQLKNVFVKLEEIAGVSEEYQIIVVGVAVKNVQDELRKQVDNINAVADALDHRKLGLGRHFNALCNILNSRISSVRQLFGQSNEQVQQLASSVSKLENLYHQLVRAMEDHANDRTQTTFEALKQANRELDDALRRIFGLVGQLGVLAAHGAYIHEILINHTLHGLEGAVNKHDQQRAKDFLDDLDSHLERMFAMNDVPDDPRLGRSRRDLHESVAKLKFAANDLETTTGFGNAVGSFKQDLHKATAELEDHHNQHHNQQEQNQHYQDQHNQDQHNQDQHNQDQHQHNQDQHHNHEDQHNVEQHDHTDYQEDNQEHTHNPSN